MTSIDQITPIPSTTSGPLVVAPIYDGLCTFEFSIVAEIFGLSRPEMGPHWYRFASAAVEPGWLRAAPRADATPSAAPPTVAFAVSVTGPAMRAELEMSDRY